MKTIEAEIDIATAPAEVWGVLMRFADYGAWNPFMTAIDGVPVLGKSITVHVAATPGATLPIKAEIISLRENEEIAWRSHLVMPGFFDRDHTITLTANATGCIVRQSQTFEGPLAGAAALLAEGVTQQGLSRMNAALKRRVEAIPANN